MICFLSFMMLLGTIGAMENDAISIKDAMIRCTIFLIIFGISSIKYWSKEDKMILRRKIEKFF